MTSTTRRPLTIGVNALYLSPGGVGGTEVYLRNLLAACARIGHPHRIVSFTNAETGGDPLPGTSLPLAVRAANRPARIAWEQLMLPLACTRHGVDVLLSPGFTAPLLAPCPTVTVFHDLQHKRHPEHFRWWDLPFWRLLLFQSAVSSTRLIAVSHNTKRDLLHYYPLRDAAIDVIHHGVDVSFFSLARAPEDLLLCVSTLHPHKNVERLVRVFGALHARHPGLCLVLAGIKGFATERIEAAIAASGCPQAIRITGWLGRDELRSLYARARVFVYPSTFEGFGMPVLEAMAAGIPTVCSDIAPLREVAGAAAALFDPHDDASLLAALDRTLASPPDTAAARARAQTFTWEATARATLAACEAAAGPGL
ncbi:MAG: glycosyltransferase family 4 protein [Bryobacterales bacterium]|nr:glycosyltransferase family 4 protein [Bryobacterales bacterium]